MIPFGRGIAGPDDCSPALRLASRSSPSNEGEKQEAAPRAHENDFGPRATVAMLQRQNALEMGRYAAVQFFVLNDDGTYRVLSPNEFERERYRRATATRSARLGDPATWREGTRYIDPVAEALAQRVMAKEWERVELEIAEQLFAPTTYTSANPTAEAKPLTIEDVTRAARLLPPKPPPINPYGVVRSDVP